LLRALARATARFWPRVKTLLTASVIGGVLLRMHGFVHGRGWASPDAEQEFNRFYQTLWDYEAMGRKTVDQASVPERQAYIERVKRWLVSRRG
jgi:hypothetical protein